MALLIILICLGLQRFLDIRVSLADYDWFKPYLGFLEKYLKETPLWTGYAGVAAVVLPAALGVALVDYIANNWIHGIIDLFVSVAVLLYCLDGRDYGKLLSGSLGEGDVEDATEQAEQFLAAKPSKSDATVNKALTEAVFTKSLHQVFSVLFWFLLLGPFGAALYFMVALLNQSKDLKDFHEAGALVLGVLDWVPVRLLGLSFALVGSFANVFMPWVKALSESIHKSNELAVTFGLAALGLDSKKSDKETIQGAVDLCFRAQVVWVVVLALMTLASYF